MFDRHRDEEAYHEGERAVQAKAGVREEARRVASMIRSDLARNMREFLTDQPLAVAGTADLDGRVWVSLLADEPGFMTAIEPDTVQINTTLPESDPLADHRRDGMHMGVLVIDPRDRSRLRINGVAHVTPGGFELGTREVYPNCPKYIQQRSFDRIVSDDGKHSVHHTAGLTDTHRDWIRTADTFFIATVHPEHGADASHRGGDPGFIEVHGDTICFPDYPGNNMFCTLGNINTNPNAGLLFVDFETGRTLQLTGEADVHWDGAPVARYEAADRVIRFEVSRAIDNPDGNPLRGQLEQRSPTNP